MIYCTKLPVFTGDRPADINTLITATAMARTRKSPAEIAALRVASERTGAAIVEMWRHFRWHDGMMESEIDAAFRFRGARLGCPDVSFLTIVGTGNRSCCLHYCKGEGLVGANDLILLDCGLFFCHYAGDITRTFPASGKFNELQATVYNYLLVAQCSLIEEVRPGVHFLDLYQLALELIFNILRELGVVPPDAAFNEAIAGLFMPHDVLHHIGVNVHDVCDSDIKSRIPDTNRFERAYRLAPGMVISIEPGIYFHQTRIQEFVKEPSFFFVNVDRALQLSREISGLRIEDDVVVTETGHDVLTASCPKNIWEIEALIGAAWRK
jgi:Xaa-Pro aminopeptidase